jgi:hypothetical protein
MGLDYQTTPTTTYLSDQTREDLERLLDEQDVGWAVYALGGTTPAVRTGIGGCLSEQMTRLLDRQGITIANSIDELRSRKLKMINALGFNYPLAMMAWNDAQTDPDMIRHRIKDALNGESNAR